MNKAITSTLKYLAGTTFALCAVGFMYYMETVVRPNHELENRDKYTITVKGDFLNTEYRVNTYDLTKETIAFSDVKGREFIIPVSNLVSIEGYNDQ